MDGWMDGMVYPIILAYWLLKDSDHDGYLTQEEMNSAVYGNIQPLEKALREAYLTLPTITKKQRKKFEAFMKYYTRDQEDYPTKLRSVSGSGGGGNSGRLIFAMRG